MAFFQAHGSVKSDRFVAFGSLKSILVERCPINLKFSGFLALFQKHSFLRYLEKAVLRAAATPPVVEPASASSPFLRL